MGACVGASVSVGCSVNKQVHSACTARPTCTQCVPIFYFTAAQAPSTVRRFHKSPFSSPAKQNVFANTSILLSFLLVHTKTLESDENDWDLGLHLCRCSDLEWSQSLRLYLSTLQTFSTEFTFSSAFSKDLVNDRREHGIENYPFLNENASVWTAPQMIKAIKNVLSLG